MDSAASSSSDEGKVFVGGIGWDTTEERLKDHFGQFGDVAQAMIVRDKLTSNPRGFGFVLFSDPSIVDSVIQKPHTIDGRTVEVKRAMSREEQRDLKSRSTNAGGNFGGSEDMKTKKIFVGGLPSTSTEDDLREYFQDYGSVTDVVIMYDPNTSRPRGFGFITFTTEDAVDGIIQKPFHKLNEKLVEVKRALPKGVAVGGASPGGYRGFGSYNSSARTFGNRTGITRTMPSPQPAGGGYPTYSSYGTSGYGYGVGNSNFGYSPYSGYAVSGYGNVNVGYAGASGVYGNPNSPNTNFSRNQWRSPAAGYAGSGYGQTAGYGASSPLKWDGSRNNSNGYTPPGRSPSGASRYGNRDNNYNAYGRTGSSHTHPGAAANAGHNSGGGGYAGRAYGRSSVSPANANGRWKPET